MTSQDGPLAVVVAVAWGDMDAFGHVNNTVFLRWFETARIALFERAGIVGRMEAERIGPILASTRCDFKLPLQYPDTVTAEVGISSIGRTSFVMTHRVRSEANGGAIAAVGEGVVVMLDYNTGAKVPINEVLRGRLEGFQII